MPDTSQAPIDLDEDAIARLILENALDFAILTTDLDGRVTSWSPGAETLLGWSEGEMLGREVCLIFTPEDLARDACNLEMRTADERGRAEDERWHLRKDGNRFWSSGLLMPLRSEGGDVQLGYLKILRDQTAQHRSQQLHQHSTDILESIVDAFYAVDEEWRFTYVNQRAEELWGRRRDDLLGTCIWEQFPQKAGTELYNAHHRVMERRNAERVEAFSVVLQRWVETDIHPTSSGGLSVYFRDISARKEREQLLRDSEARLRLAVDAARIVIWEFDIRNERLNFTPELTSFLGLSADETPTVEAVRARYYPEDRERIRSLASAALERGERNFEAEFRFYRSPDDLRWFALRGEVMFSAEGAPEKVIGAAMDITERKATEEALRELKDSLEQQVQERTRELLNAEEALRQSQKLETIGQLTGGVAHDFNNLLTIIRSSVDLIRRPDFPEEKKSRYVEAISETVDRASKLTSQLLAFARRQALTPQTFDVASRTREITEMVGTLIGGRVDLKLDAHCANCFVEADPSQFETAIVNLAVNARDAMGPEGVLRVSVRAVDRLPPIRGHQPGDGEYIAVAVSDTGTGIPPEALSSIFEPFYTTKEPGKGTGLGLSQVYGFAKQSGGDVAVESAVGKGTTFTLYLPRVPKPAEATSLKLPESNRKEWKCRILVVEDNTQVGEFAQNLLQELGHTVTLAPNGRAALDILAKRSCEFDFVFTDVVMPGMSGIELAKEIKRHYPDLKIILTSGYSHVLAEEGTYGFPLLQKPYSLEALTDALE